MLTAGPAAPCGKTMGGPRQHSGHQGFGPLIFWLVPQHCCPGPGDRFDRPASRQVQLAEHDRDNTAHCDVIPACLVHPAVGRRRWGIASSPTPGSGAGGGMADS